MVMATDARIAAEMVQPSRFGKGHCCGKRLAPRGHRARTAEHIAGPFDGRAPEKSCHLARGEVDLWDYYEAPAYAARECERRAGGSHDGDRTNAGDRGRRRRSDGYDRRHAGPFDSPLRRGGSDGDRRWLSRVAVAPRKTNGVVGSSGRLPSFLYGVVPTLQPAHFGRVYAAYGGVFVVLSLLWGWWIDGHRPDTPEIAGSALCIVGVGIIMYWPRPT